MRNASVDDRLAGSTDYLAMLATAVAGWLMSRQLNVAEAQTGEGAGSESFLIAKRRPLDSSLIALFQRLAVDVPGRPPARKDSMLFLLTSSEIRTKALKAGRGRADGLTC